MVQKNFKSKVKSCVINGDSEELRLLYASQDTVDPDLPLTGSGKTALMLAAREGHLGIAWILVELGCNVILQDDEGRSALMRACEGGHLELVIFLFHRGGDIFQWNVWGRTPLLISAFFGHWHIVQFLVSHGAHIHESSIDRKTALHIAIERDFTNIALLFLDYGCGVHEKSSSGESAIMLAAVRSNFTIIDALLRKGAVMTEPLCAASAAGNLPVVKHLLGRGADINGQDEGGWTPLMHSCASDQMATVAFLLSQGASISIEDNEGKSALCLASGSCKKHLEGSLNGMNEVCNLEDQLIWALRHDSAEAVMALIAENDGKEDAAQDNPTAFCGDRELKKCILSEVLMSKNKIHNVVLLASQRGYHVIVRQLIQRGGDIESQDASGKTCIMYAAEGGHTETVEVLAEAGGLRVVNATDRDGWGALTYASKAGATDIIRLLVIQYGAAIDMLDIHGKTAVHYADREKHYDVVSLLFIMRAKKAQSIVGKYLYSKDNLVVEVGLSCMEAILPHNAIECSHWQSPTASAALLCSDDVVDALLRLIQCGSHSCRLRAESLLEVSKRYKEYDIFNAIASENWDLVLEISDFEGSAMRDRSERLPLHHLLIDNCGCATDTVLHVLHLYPAAAGIVDPVTSRLPIVSALLRDMPASLISALVVAYPQGVDAVCELSPEWKGRFWATPFHIEALSASHHRLWFAMVQDEGVQHSAYYIQQVLGQFPDLLYTVNECGRSAYSLATSAHQLVMQPLLLWHDRYFLTDGSLEYHSDTSVVVMAYDTITLDSTGASTMVALKLMTQKNAFAAELRARNASLDSYYVQPVIAAYPNSDQNLSMHTIDFKNVEVSSDRALFKKRAESLYTLVMPWADRNMCSSWKHDRFMWADDRYIKQIFVSLTKALQHIHAQGLVHGDFQPMNILRSGDSWKLCDLDQCGTIGTPLPLSKVSTAYLPPEAVHVEEARFACVRNDETRKVRHLNYELLVAHPSFDMWALGCVLFRLCTGRPLFLADYSDDLSADISDEDSLFALAIWNEEYKKRKLGKFVNPFAFNLISQLLSKDPLRRPSASRVLVHPFISGKTDVVRLIGQDPLYDAFISYQGAEDLQYASLLRDKLLSCGLNVWLSERATNSPKQARYDALLNSNAFICLFSESFPTQEDSILEGLALDQMLFDCRLALELQNIGLISTIFPLLRGSMLSGYYIDMYEKNLQNFCMPSGPGTYLRSMQHEICQILESQSLGPPVCDNLTVGSTLKRVTEFNAIRIKGEIKSDWENAVDIISSILVLDQPSPADNNSTTSATSITIADHPTSDKEGQLTNAVALVDVAAQTTGADAPCDTVLPVDRLGALHREIENLKEMNSALESRERRLQNIQRVGCLVLLVCGISSFVLYRRCSK